MDAGASGGVVRLRVILFLKVIYFRALRQTASPPHHRPPANHRPSPRISSHPSCLPSNSSISSVA